MAIPKIYIRSHAITYIPFLPHSNWPLENELLFTISLLIGSETLAHLITWAAFGLVCGAIFWFAQRYWGTEMGLLTAAIFAAAPVVTTLAGTALIELPLTLFTFLAVISLITWLENGERSQWGLSAIFGGLAASTKLNGALTPLLLACFMVLVLFLRRTYRITQLVKYFVSYGLIAFCVVAPWYLKSWVLAGDPIWPFLGSFFGARDWDALGDQVFFGFIRMPNMPLTPANWLLGLWKLSSQPSRFGSYRFNLGWFYLILLPLAIPVVIRALWPASPAARSRQVLHLFAGETRLGYSDQAALLQHSNVLWIAFLSVVFYTAWFFQTHQTRFLMPATPLFALLGSLSAGWLWSLFSTVWWRPLIQACLAGSLLAASWIASPGDRAQVTAAWPYLTGRINRNQYLETQVPGYAAFVYANKNLPSTAYVWMALYEVRGYYLNLPYMWANPISQRALRLELFDDAGQLSAALHSQGITHVLLQTSTLDKYTDFPFGEKEAGLTRQLVAENARLLYSTPSVEVYELLP